MKRKEETTKRKKNANLLEKNSGHVIGCIRFSFIYLIMKKNAIK
jgi:hypothetical protein